MCISRMIMWYKNRIVIGMLFGIVMLVIMLVIYVDFLLDEVVFIFKYMVIVCDSEIYLLVGEQVIFVGEVKED